MTNTPDEDISYFGLPDVQIIDTPDTPETVASHSPIQIDLTEDGVIEQNNSDVGVASDFKRSDNYGEGSSQSSSGYGSYDGSNKKRKNVGKSDHEVINKKSLVTNALGKNNRKQKNDEEKSSRKLIKELTEVYKPGECMKYIYVEIHTKLLNEWYSAELFKEVLAAGSNILPSDDMFDPGIVMWSRKIPQKSVNSDGKLELGLITETCNRALLVRTAKEVAPLACANQLTKHVTEIAAVANCPVTLVIFGVKDYWKSLSKKSDKDVKMTEKDLEIAITDLLVSTGNCDAAKVNTASEFVQLIVQTTKAIAEAPYKHSKRACDEQADFYLRGEKKKSVSVDKEGRGLGSLWQQMLAVLPQSSLETARALTAQFPSPLALYKALSSHDSISKVADIGVCRATVPGAKPRRIGPEFAKKLHMLFTADDANLLID
ncbi:Crossover junction endonuclease EME1 [Eumeta japonica]|uniref:Crossover junction endonuclease EME1 n=1 Tax=Eumeta variegata TaxID=151549 RepID=A0A4C1UCP9_EUMVA|nr:Crossover junction endonuclease EME1 [Eumeta japonica]